MYILINGAFGVGKTTVARELRARLAATIFDPEIIGLVLQRAPRYRLSDFQHLGSWRRMTILGARACGAFRRTVIIPMAFSDTGYLDEVRGGLLSSGRPVFHFCLTAPFSVVQERLARRGEVPIGRQGSWVYRRARERCAAHQDAAFAVHVATDGRTPGVIAEEISDRIRAATGVMGMGRTAPP